MIQPISGNYIYIASTTAREILVLCMLQIKIIKNCNFGKNIYQIKGNIHENKINKQRNKLLLALCNKPL